MEPYKSYLAAQSNEDEIDLREIFSIIFRYKRSIILISIVFVAFSYQYAYFKPNIYQSSALIKLTSDERQVDDLIGIGYDFNSDTEDEASIIQTQKIAKKALENLNLGTQYYVNKYFKSYELYKESPFVALAEMMDPKLEGVRFELIPIDDTKFRLRIKQSLKTKILNTLYSFTNPDIYKTKPILYDQIHHFGKKIITPFFVITIQKTHPLTDKNYAFSITPNEDMDAEISGGLSASSYTKEGSIIEINYNDTVPLRAKDILDAVVNAYIEDRLLYKTEGAKKKLYFIDMQLQAISETLKGSAEKLQDYKATNIVINLSEKAQQASGKLGELESQHYEINMQIDVLENILNYIQTHDDIRGINVGSAQEISPIINSLISQIQEATSQYAILSVNYTKEHPDILKINKQLDSLKGSLREAILSSLRTLNKRKHSLQSLIEEHKSALKSLPEQEKRLEELSRNFTVNEKIHTMLLEERAETAIAQSSTVSDVRIIEPAFEPGGAIQPRRQLIILVGLILGLIFGIALAFLRDFLNSTVKTIDEIEKLSTIPIYGSIPHLDTKKNIEHHKEAMRALWINLEFSHRTDKSKLLTFTSSVSGEGKSHIISHLADTIARSSKRAIILDLDMRKASLCKKYDLPNSIGMSTLLAKKHTLSDVIQMTPHKNLHIITSGPKPPNPTELIMDTLLDAVIDELRESYDYILIDSPPVGLVADAVKIMRLSDITLIVLKANFTQKEFLKTINRYVKKDKIHLGIILNDADEGKTI